MAWIWLESVLHKLLWLDTLPLLGWKRGSTNSHFASSNNFFERLDELGSSQLQCPLLYCLHIARQIRKFSLVLRSLTEATRSTQVSVAYSLFAFTCTFFFPVMGLERRRYRKDIAQGCKS
jgi:hypothetical protein